MVPVAPVDLDTENEWLLEYEADADADIPEDRDMEVQG